MILDDINRINGLDSQNMLQMVYNWPELIEEVIKQPFEMEVDEPITNIVICGMGGSAVSGDYLRTLLEETLPIPITIQRNYDLPAFAKESTLVILISYSGDTEETISCLIDVIKQKTKVVGISSGGTLENYFKEHKLPFFHIQEGYQPRASFPLLFFPLLLILNSINLYHLNKGTLDNLLSLLRQIRDEIDRKVPTENNRAKQIAQELFNTIPVIWSPYLCTANRMKCQLNENSKTLAIAEELPELNHNHIVGFENWSQENPFYILVNRFSSEHPNVSQRFVITKEIIEKKVPFIEIHARGETLLEQLLSCTYIGDYISIYVAILNQQDPNTVDSINYLKKEMEKRTQTQSAIVNALKKL
ncbi:MAG: bifunctional phosphoglucose/phosphomannose isomerase [Candidatus Heimdallarchaeota archaeon]|nr:bifunctional phosphoglucose/phosphomannose isomerase [Candidatus Heimdallarchaeota archaeon]